MRKLHDKHIKLCSLDKLTKSKKTTDSSKKVKMEDICKCSMRKLLPRCNLMDEAIESTNTPIKHLNRLTQKPWRFRSIVTMKKRFSKRNYIEESKT
jgi:hypothetical protein